MTFTKHKMSKFLARQKSKLLILLSLTFAPVLLYYELGGYVKTLAKVAKDILANDINFSLSFDPDDIFFALFVPLNGEYMEADIPKEVFDLNNVIRDGIIPKTRFNK